MAIIVPWLVLYRSYYGAAIITVAIMTWFGTGERHTEVNVKGWQLLSLISNPYQVQEIPRPFTVLYREMELGVQGAKNNVIDEYVIHGP